MSLYHDDYDAARYMLHVLAVIVFVVGAAGFHPFRMLLIGLALWCWSRVGR